MTLKDAPLPDSRYQDLEATNQGANFEESRHKAEGVFSSRR